MMTTPHPAPNEQPNAFLNAHQEIIATALAVYSERMREAATEASDNYEAIADDPQARAAQDRTFLTTEGLRMASELFLQSAERADTARQDLADLADNDE